MEQRRVRVRPSDFTVTETATQRRGGRAKPKAARDVVSYFGDDTDTPMIEMLKRIPPNADKFREGDHIHVSDVISKCVRKIALMKRMGMTHPAETVYDGMGITYAIGEALHDFVKARFIKGHPDKVYAKWTCPCEETEFVGVFRDRPKQPCPRCKMAVLKHNEIRFIYEHYMLSGSPDLLLLLPEYDAFLITEIKSMAAEMFKDLCRPHPSHVVQVALYWHIMKFLGYVVMNRVSILYTNKEYSFKLPYKEFLIDPTTVDLDPYWEDLDALKAALAGGDLPARTVCGSSSAPEAKKCPVCVTCFGQS